jgi:hypothetical protein
MLYSDSLAWNVIHFLARCRRQLAYSCTPRAAHTIHGVCVCRSFGRLSSANRELADQRVPGKRCNYVCFFAAARFSGLLLVFFYFKLIRLIYFLTYKANNCQVSQSGFFYPLGVGGFLRAHGHFFLAILVISEFT